MSAALENDEEGLRDAALRLRADMEDAVFIRFETFSMRQPEAPIPVSALGGQVRCSGTLEPFLPYLLIAEHSGVGSTAAKGLGQVDMILA